jgi:hypothetical protein
MCSRRRPLRYHELGPFPCRAPVPAVAPLMPLPRRELS